MTSASDLYSIGVILYEALTGQVPFEGDSAVRSRSSRSPSSPPAERLNPAVTPALDAVVLAALAKDPANRFASAEEFAAALDAAEADPATSATQRFRRRRRPRRGASRLEPVGRR